MISTSTYQRKTFRVQAIQVTVENMAELADWCGGDKKVYKPEASKLSGDYRAGQWCIQVTIHRVAGRMIKTHAFAGDWITRLTEANNFRVYPDKSFSMAFTEISSAEEKYKEVLELIEEDFGPTPDPNVFIKHVVRENLARQIVALFEGKK